MNKPANVRFVFRARRKAARLLTGIKWKVLSVLFRLPSIEIESIVEISRSDISEPIMDDICMPPFVPGLEHDDLGTVLRIAKNLRPRVICEVGTAHGNLTANLLRNCPEATIITVNAPLELQSGELVTYRLNPDEIGRVYRRYGYQERVTQLLINSLDLDLSQHVSETIDLAIVDGCHDLDFVLNDFEKVRRFVSSGGVVLFHDTNPSQEGHLASSYRACLLLRRRGVDVKWIQGTWWGYWRKEAAMTMSNA